MEKQSTQLVEYDYMIIAKIVSGIVRFENMESYLEEIKELFGSDDENDASEIAGYTEIGEEIKNIPDEVKRICTWNNIKYINQILTGDSIFSSYDRQRQVALQYFLNIFTCVVKGEMINRNVSEKTIIELSDVPKKDIEEKLIKCNQACQKMIDIYDGVDSFWKNKTSFFTLCYVLSIYPITKSANLIRNSLNDFMKSDSLKWQQYYEASSQGVNDKRNREIRERIIGDILK